MMMASEESQRWPQRRANDGLRGEPTMASEENQRWPQRRANTLLCRSEPSPTAESIPSAYPRFAHPSQAFSLNLMFMLALSLLRPVPAHLFTLKTTH